MENKKISVVIPAYKVKKHILKVVSSIGDEVFKIIVVDDCCPEGTASYLESHCKDKRLVIVRHEYNQGVGGAVLTGYGCAIKCGADIIVKIDGDEQMDSSLIPNFIHPILMGYADYTKGNRFFDLDFIENMPIVRVFGNAMLSLMAKISTGYWNIFDPTNGYTAIHSKVAAVLPANKISKRYFFETDMLFRLGTINAVVVDIPMRAKYGDEVSNLKIKDIVFEFMGKHIVNTIKRVFYMYYLRGFSAASIQLPLGLAMIIFAIAYGGGGWLSSIHSGVLATAGEVMIAALPFIVGMQFFLSFLSYDIFMTPKMPIHPRLGGVNSI